MKVCYAADPFVAEGFRRRVFFPHEVIVLRKAYPDTFVQMEKRGVAGRRESRHPATASQPLFQPDRRLAPGSLYRSGCQLASAAGRPERD